MHWSLDMAPVGETYPVGVEPYEHTRAKEDAYEFRRNLGC